MNGCVHLDVWATNGTKIYFAGTPAGRVAGRGVAAKRFAGTPTGRGSSERVPANRFAGTPPS